MDDLSAKLTELLSDPESMNRVRQMAESILGENNEPKKEIISTPDISGIGDMLASGEIQSIISIISRMKSIGDDSRVKLIYALKPHLSEDRQKRADMAIKILKLLDALPLIKESGLLNF